MTSVAVNALGQKLLLKWRKEHPTESIIFSPFAAAATLCLIREGAAGDERRIGHRFMFPSKSTSPLITATAAYLQDTMKFRELEAKFNGTVETDSNSLPIENFQSILMTNHIYVDKSVPLERDFMRAVGSRNITQKNFQNRKPSIEELVKEETGEKGVRHAVTFATPGISSDETLMMMITSTNFRGGWLQTLSRCSCTFHGVSGKTYAHPALRGRFDGLLIKEVPELGCQLFKMPYTDGKFGMFILLPTERDGWKNAERMLPAHLPGGLFTDGLKSMKVNFTVASWRTGTELDVLAGLFESPSFETVLDHASDFFNMSRDPIKILPLCRKPKSTSKRMCVPESRINSRCLNLAL